MQRDDVLFAQPRMAGDKGQIFAVFAAVANGNIDNASLLRGGRGDMPLKLTQTVCERGVIRQKRIILDEKRSVGGNHFRDAR